MVKQYTMAEALQQIEVDEQAVGIRRLSWDNKRVTINKAGRGLKACSATDIRGVDWIVVYKTPTIDDLAVHYASNAEPKGSVKQDLIAAFLAGHAARTRRAEGIQVVETEDEPTNVVVESGEEIDSRELLGEEGVEAAVELPGGFVVGR